jgi:hypothetical protein
VVAGKEERIAYSSTKNRESLFGFPLRITAMCYTIEVTTTVRRVRMESPDARQVPTFDGLGLYAYSEMLSIEKICTGISVDWSRDTDDLSCNYSRGSSG